MSEKSYSLNYFNKVGKIELCRLIFAAANVSYEDNYIEKLTDSDLQLGYMPFLRVDSNNEIPCISTIARFLAREFNLAGQSNIEQAQTDSIAQSVMLLIDSYYRNVKDVEDMDTKHVGLKNFLEQDIENAGAIIERCVEMYCEKPKREGRLVCNGFSVGNSLTYADLFIYEMVTKYFPYDTDTLPAKFPNIYAIKENVGSLNSIKSFEKNDKNQCAALSKDAINDLSNE